MFSNIVLSGGGMGAISYLGCFKYIDEHKDIKMHIKNILGVSSGAIFSLFFIFDFTYAETISFLDKLKSVNMSIVNIKSILNLNKAFGFDNGDKLMEVVKLIYDLKNIDHDITFQEIAKKFGRNLIVATANISKGQLFYFCVDNTPEVRVIDAVKASSSIPFIFTPFIYNDEFHVDAFIYDNFPITYFKETLDHTIGLNLVNEKTPITGIISFIQNIFNTSVDFKASPIHENECNLITKGNGFNIKKMQFILDETTITTQIDLGYNTIKTFVDKKLERLNKFH
jgi:predicted acylesterase/phospholipase RssA